MGNVDKDLLAFHQDLVRTYSFPLGNERCFLSISGTEGFSFEVMQSGKLIGSFRAVPGSLYEATENRVGFSSSNGQRVYRGDVVIEGEETTLIVARDMKTTENLLLNSLLILAIGIGATVFAIALFGRQITRRFLQPIEDIGTELQRISGSEINGERIEVNITG